MLKWLICKYPPGCLDISSEHKACVTDKVSLKHGSPKGTLGEKKVVKIAISFPRNNISFEQIIISWE